MEIAHAYLVMFKNQQLENPLKYLLSFSLSMEKDSVTHTEIHLQKHVQARTEEREREGTMERDLGILRGIEVNAAI